MKFIHSDIEYHAMIDMESVGSVAHYVRSDNYNSWIRFYSKEGESMGEWEYENKQKDLLLKTVEDIKRHVESININQTINL
jgi:desulfoferrodoxin (superoxide reductase-like protein)